MQYENIVSAIFLERPNRFIARCLLNGEEVIAHVKNTGRCKELLIPGVPVYLQHHDNPARKTAFSLICVQKGKRLINIDSQAPNQAAWDALRNSSILLPGFNGPPACIKREAVFGNSRLDFYLEQGSIKAFAEVKGVTLEKNGIVLFPDVPTQRGVKHLNELCHVVQAGMRAYVIFIVQMQNVSYFTPNIKTHPAFGQALRHACENGVTALCYDCKVTPELLEIRKRVEIHL